EAIPSARVEHPGDEIVERLRLLQIAQAGRVGRRNIDGEVARDLGESLNQPRVVRRPVTGITGGSDIDSENSLRFQPRDEPRMNGGRAVIVEAEPVDDALVRVQAEEAGVRGARVSG